MGIPAQFIMNFTILGPNDNKLKDDKSSMTASDFGGNREYSSNTSDAKDYTKRTGRAPNKKENPVDDTTKDVDDMTDPYARKREFSRREETSNVQKSNESVAIQSDSDRRPRMDEGNDAVQVPEASDLRQLKKANRWQYDSSNRYEGEIS